MPDQRTYTEEEVAAIFERAAKEQQESLQKMNKNAGLSLSELQEIGEQTGIDPALISKAAASMETAKYEAPPSKMLGIQTSVSRVVQLDGRLSDDDWARLVIEMREIFHAHGKVEQQGSVRSWRNGNLRITVEPTDSGDRLRMGSKKGNAQGTIIGSLAVFAILIGAMISMFLFDGSSGGLLSIRTLIIVIAAGGLGVRLNQLPRWSKEREQQMDALGIMAQELVQKTVARGKKSESAERTNAPLEIESSARIDESLLSSDDENVRVEKSSRRDQGGQTL